MPIVAVLLLQAGPGEIGVIAAVQSLPFLLLSIPLGLLADRMSRKKLMVVSELLRVFALMVLIGAMLLDQISVTLLACVGFLASVGTVGFSVSAPSLVPSLVGLQHLATANGRLELARSMAFAGGPALAGALIAWMGASTSFVLSLMMSLAAVGFLSQIQEPSRQSAPDRHPWYSSKMAQILYGPVNSCAPSCSHQLPGIFLGLFCKPSMCLMPCIPWKWDQAK